MILPLTVIIVLVLVAVVTGVAVHFAQSGRKGGTFMLEGGHIQVGRREHSGWKGGTFTGLLIR